MYIFKLQNTSLISPKVKKKTYIINNEEEESTKRF